MIAYDGGSREAEVRIWHGFYERLEETLLTFGKDGYTREDDYWIDDDYIGTRQQKIYVQNLKILAPVVVDRLQKLVGQYPGWEIMVAVAVSGQGDSWPMMGLTIRPHEIIDGLQREYFPLEHRGYFYPGSRVGTDRD